MKRKLLITFVTVLLFFANSTCFAKSQSFSLESFEYNDISECWMHNGASDSGIKSLQIVTDKVKDESKALKIDYDFVDAPDSTDSIVALNGGKAFPTVDKEKYTAVNLKAFVYGNESYDELFFRIKDSEGSFKDHTVNLDFAGYKEIVIPLKTKAEAVALCEIGINYGWYLEEKTNIIIDGISIEYSEKTDVADDVVIFSKLTEDFEQGGNWMFAADEYTNNGGSMGISNSNEQILNGSYSLKLDYNFVFSDSARETYFDIASTAWQEGGMIIPCDSGKTIKNIGMWIYGDGTNVQVDFIMYKGDKAERLCAFEMKDGISKPKSRIDWTGWKYVTFYPDTAQNANIKENVRLFGFSVSRDRSIGKGNGAIYFDDLSVNYQNTENFDDFCGENFGVNEVTTPSYEKKSSIPFDYSNKSSLSAKNNITINESVFKPRGVGMYLYGDYSGNRIYMNFSDSSLKSTKSDSICIDWEGWKYVEFDIPANIQAPILVKDVVVQENSYTNENKCIYLSSPKILYSLLQEVRVNVEHCKIFNPNENILIDFKVPIDASTINDKSFTIKSSEDVFSDYSVVKKTSKQYEVVLNAPLIYNKDYKIIVNSSVKSIFGEPCKKETDFKTSAYGINNVSYTNESGKINFCGTVNGKDNEKVCVVSVVYEKTDDGLIMKDIVSNTYSNMDNFTNQNQIKAYDIQKEYQVYIFIWDDILNRKPLLSPYILGI